MRPLHVTLVSLWPRGGMLHYTSQLANALAAQPNLRVAAVVPRSAATVHFASAVTLVPVDVPTALTSPELLKAPFKLLKLPRFLSQIAATRPDVLHLNSSHVWLALTLPYLRQRYPVIATVHDVGPHPGGDDTWRKRLERGAVLRWAHRLVVHRERLRQQLLAVRPDRASSDVLLIARGQYLFLRDLSAGGTRDAATVLFFGRIQGYKGLRYLLDAAPKIRRRLPKVRIVIAGQGDLRPFAAQLTDRSLFEVDNRFIPDDEVAGYFRRATLVALPYIEASESGIVGIAWGCGTPVVATTVGCLPDAIEHGETGLLVPPRDSDALAAAIVELLENPALCARLSASGRARVETTDGWDEAARALIPVYRELAHSRALVRGLRHPMPERGSRPGFFRR
jgi:glycosyltransferase involved in cell wall biosynthesis